MTILSSLFKPGSAGQQNQEQKTNNFFCKENVPIQPPSIGAHTDSIAVLNKHQCINIDDTTTDGDGTCLDSVMASSLLSAPSMSAIPISSPTPANITQSSIATSLSCEGKCITEEATVQLLDEGKHKHITFNNTIQVRLHNIVLDDNPSTSVGPPVALGWDYSSKEEQLQHDDACKMNVSEKSEHFHLASDDRVERLKEFGFTQEEIYNAINELQKSRFNQTLSSNELQPLPGSPHASLLPPQRSSRKGGLFSQNLSSNSSNTGSKSQRPKATVKVRVKKTRVEVITERNTSKNALFSDKSRHIIRELQQQEMPLTPLISSTKITTKSKKISFFKRIFHK